MLHKEVEIFQSGSKSANTYGTRANTVSIRDFTKIAVYEGLKKKNERGIVILAAMAEYGIEQTIELAFTGKSLDRILSKIKHYTTWTHDELMQVLTENREDVAKLRLGLFY